MFHGRVRARSVRPRRRSGTSTSSASGGVIDVAPLDRDRRRAERRNCGDGSSEGLSPTHALELHGRRAIGALGLMRHACLRLVRDSIAQRDEQPATRADENGGATFRSRAMRGIDQHASSRQPLETAVATDRGSRCLGRSRPLLVDSPFS